jgi:3-oxoacyl-[acyl-carrier protein] reductase
VKLEGATVLITGGAAGIGLRAAQRFAALGARVWAADNNDAAVAELALAGGPNPRFVRCDVAVAEQVEALVARIETESSGLNIVVNNAAILRDQTLVSRLGKRIKRHSIDDWQATLDSNLTGTFLTARAAAAAMIDARRPGLIINTSSVVRSGNPGQSAYAATKAGIAALTVTWSRELAPYGIRVAAIAPGFVETGMTRSIPAVFLERIRRESPVGRFGELDEFVEGLRFIISNDYFAGRVLELDGGLRF